MAPLNILISGCGIGGPVLASFLLLNPNQSATNKPHITIVERASSVRPQGQGIDIRGAGAVIIKKLGLDTAIQQRITGEEGAAWVDRNNRVIGAFAADKSGKIQTGTSNLEIMRGELANIVYERSLSISKGVQSQGGKGIEYIFGDGIDELEQDDEKVTVHFAKTGKQRSFDLVVGSDGLLSQTRRLAFGTSSESARIKSLNLYTAFWSMPRAETDTAWRRWYSAPSRALVARPTHIPDRTSGYFMLANATDNRLAGVADAGRKSVDEQKALLNEYFSDAGWEAERLIREMNNAEDFYYSPVAQIHMGSEGWHKGRVVLLGDAGYCASPISGMGTTLALTGAYNLAGSLTNVSGSPSSADLTAAFEKYSAAMAPTVESAQRLPMGGKAIRLLVPLTEWGLWLRNWFLWSVYMSNVSMLLAKWGGQKANEVKVEDYGFPQLEEWERSKE
jgi:2-polyprenyl-6-methoxyphenol hydroxylase-like FAD-dependent oxidoreductase